MRDPRKFLGWGLPYLDIEDLPGRLIVIEGSDAVGRTTQIQLLRTWLEYEGHGVIETGWGRSPLVAQTIDSAKEGHTMNVLTFNLLYATDFADRLEHEIIPALRAGFIVLSDRYIYTVMARAAVRGAHPEWIRDMFSIAIQPDIVVYLNSDVKTLVKRALLSRGLDYWESGLDQNPGLDPYESFLKYQAKLVREFNRLAKEFNFEVVNARASIDTVQKTLRDRIRPVLTSDMMEARVPLELEDFNEDEDEIDDAIESSSEGRRALISE